MYSLPDDVLCQVFRTLSKDDLWQCARVEKSHWYPCALDTLWHSIELVVGSPEWDGIKAIRGNSNRTRIRRLSVIGSDVESPVSASSSGFARFVASIGPSLSALLLETPLLSDDDLWAISARCSSLVSITLTSISAEPSSPLLVGSSPHGSLTRNGMLEQGRLTDDGLVSIASNCKNLRHLSLKSVGPLAPAFTSRGFETIANAFSYLRTFALEWNSGFGGRTSSGVSKDDGAAIAKSVCRILESNVQLSSLSVDWHFSSTELDTIVECISTNLRELTSLRIGGFWTFSSITPILVTNARIRSLTLVDMMAAVISEREVEELFLNVNSQTPEDSIPLPLRLETLELDGTGHFLSILPLAAQFSNLTRLRISPSRLSASFPFERTDTMVSEVLRALPLLRHLLIPVIGNQPLVTMSESNLFLDEVELIGGFEVTDQALILLAKGCLRLRGIHLGQATLLSDTSILVVARTVGSNLESFTLPYRSKKLTAKRILDALLEYCPNLRCLMNVPVEDDVGKEALNATLPAMPCLRKSGICLSGGHGSGGGIGMTEIVGPLFFSRVELEGLKRRCRKLKTLTAMF